jgi:hypothetical protein
MRDKHIFGNRWQTQPAMQHDQERICDVLPADHHLLIDATETEIADFDDAAGKNPVVGPTKGRHLS